jgi:radical SAM superfamily enzyme YgiQ (UPF0313 family)
MYARVMHANLAGIMAQAVAVWCEEQGHEVTFICYTGREDLMRELPADLDLVFIASFSQAAQLSYALSYMLRSRGAVTVLGGPHARCYPEDAVRHFDYVVGFTDQSVIQTILQDCAPHRPTGMHLTAPKQPEHVPGVRARWKFIELTLRKAPVFKIVGMLGSLGCPYTCSFCIDATVPYQPLDFEGMKGDLRFLLTKFKRPHVGWHDPNFGIRFDDYMSAIEEAVPPDSIDFIAETSLAMLTEEHVKRMKRNGFKALLPGIESWYDLGNKSKTGRSRGMDKVRRVSDQVNMMLRHIPYVQTNFVMGLDCDEGPEPFELTAKFLEMTPGAFPAYSLLSAFGRAAKLNLDYQRANRVIPFPFHFLNNNHAMNVRPKNYEWPAFYDHVIRLSEYSFSWSRIVDRFHATAAAIPRLLNFVRAVSSEGHGRIRYYREVRRRLDEDVHFRRYFEQETAELPGFFIERMRRDLADLWSWLPPEAIHHDAYAYLKSDEAALSAHIPSIAISKTA